MNPIKSAELDTILAVKYVSNDLEFSVSEKSDIIIKNCQFAVKLSMNLLKFSETPECFGLYIHPKTKKGMVRMMFTSGDGPESWHKLECYDDLLVITCYGDHGLVEFESRATPGARAYFTRLMAELKEFMNALSDEELDAFHLQ